MEPGVQSCEETLTHALRLVPRFGLAVGADTAASWGWRRDLCRAISCNSCRTSSRSTGRPAPPQDFTDLHAWTEVYVPGAGWIGLDPTSGLLAGEGHIPLACSPDPATAAPITGGVEECKTEFSFSMSIARIHEDPRVTKPYTDERMGARSKRWATPSTSDLQAGDVRLTMGGEPTFVSIDDMDGDEWNVAAVGPNKRRLSEALVRRLQAQFAPEALLHFGQGKWYPGESLPRWALACYWRADGKPVWRDSSLIAEEGRNSTATQRATRNVRCAAWPSIWKSTPTGWCPPTKIRGTTWPRSAICRSTSIRATRSWMMPKSERGWPASSSVGWGRSPATCCRSNGNGGKASRAGAAALGRCAAMRCFCCRAIRRSACGCRSMRCLMSHRPARGNPTPLDPTAPRDGLPDYPGAHRAARDPRPASRDTTRDVHEQETLRGGVPGCRRRQT